MEAILQHIDEEMSKMPRCHWCHEEDDHEAFLNKLFWLLKFINNHLDEDPRRQMIEVSCGLWVQEYHLQEFLAVNPRRLKEHFGEPISMKAIKEHLFLACFEENPDQYKIIEKTEWLEHFDESDKWVLIYNIPPHIIRRIPKWSCLVERHKLYAYFQIRDKEGRVLTLNKFEWSTRRFPSPDQIQKASE
jgi:hypothetical protein